MLRFKLLTSCWSVRPFCHVHAPRALMPHAMQIVPPSAAAASASAPSAAAAPSVSSPFGLAAPASTAASAPAFNWSGQHPSCVLQQPQWQEWPLPQTRVRLTELQCNQCAQMQFMSWWGLTRKQASLPPQRVLAAECEQPLPAARAAKWRASALQPFLLMLLGARASLSMLIWSVESRIVAVCLIGPHKLMHLHRRSLRQPWLRQRYSGNNEYTMPMSSTEFRRWPCLPDTVAGVVAAIQAHRMAMPCILLAGCHVAANAAASCQHDESLPTGSTMVNAAAASRFRYQVSRTKRLHGFGGRHAACTKAQDRCRLGKSSFTRRGSVGACTYPGSSRCGPCRFLCSCAGGPHTAVRPLPQDCGTWTACWCKSSHGLRWTTAWMKARSRCVAGLCHLLAWP